MSNIQSIIEQKSVAITEVTNQIVTTIYTKDQSKSKLRTDFEGIVVNYEIADATDDSFVVVDNKTVQVMRKSDDEQTCSLLANIYDSDGSTLLLTHKWDLTLLSRENSKEIKLDELRYNSNKFSQMMGYIAVVFVIANALITLNTVAPSFTQAFVFILLTIFMLLIGFLACEKVKAYKKEYSYVLMVLALVNLALIFWLPLQTIVQYGNYQAALDANNQAEAASIASKYFAATITDGAGYTSMITQNAAVRGFIMIVFNAVACGFFALAGVTGYFKAVKLEKHLASVEAKKD